MQQHRTHGYPHAGRHELGQNFLTDPQLIKTVCRLVEAESTGPIVELGAGDGALTAPLAGLRRPLTALEIDPRRARRLAASLGASADVVCADVLRYRFPDTAHVIVGNIPFHLTTAIMRRLLAERAWTFATLIVQWEVARRRAGVGGASMLTASWWPWYEFHLHRRIPATSFRPVPSVDAGLLTMCRRGVPLIGARRSTIDDQRDYQDFVKKVYQSRGRGLAEMVRQTGLVRPADLRDWMRRRGTPPQALPKDLVAEDWAELWALARKPRGLRKVADR
jgi:23S rRNA (adenine-N6)-dimethyltransferase